GKKGPSATASARREKVSERLTKPRCQRQAQPEPEALEVDVAKDDHDEEEQHEEDMQEAQPEEDGVVGLANTGFTFLDAPLLATFVKRWHAKTSSFYMSSGEMTVTLDDIRCLMYLPIEGRLLDHDGILSKAEAIELNLLGQVPLTLTMKTYLLFLVDTAIFSSKANNYIDITFLKYFRDLRMVDTYVWGPVAPAFTYWELTNAIVPMCKYFAGYLTLLQFYHHFDDIGREEDDEYEERMPHAAKLFGYVQTIQRHSHRPTPPTTTPQQIDHQYTQFLDWVLTPNMLGKHALYQWLTTQDYMTWYMKISHLYIITLPPENPPRPTELDAIVQQEASTEAREHMIWWLHCAASEITQKLMVNGNIPQDYHPYVALQEIEKETMPYIFQNRDRGVQILSRMLLVIISE
ncbi:serine/threonine-protein phosphatase 7 long form-like protein, partial [Trifolium medium]|nr:serine/threonine-protein phosphatase 7 long form-like protein [Trifolium medium]